MLYPGSLCLPYLSGKASPGPPFSAPLEPCPSTVRWVSSFGMRSRMRLPGLHDPGIDFSLVASIAPTTSTRRRFYDALWTCGRVGWCVYHTHHTFLQRLIYVVGSMICCCGSKPFDPSLLDCCLLILLQKGESLPVVPISGHGMVCRFERTPSSLLLHHCLLSHLTLRLTASCPTPILRRISGSGSCP